MEVGVRGPVSRPFDTPSAMSMAHTRLHSAGTPALVHSQAHTSSSYSIQSQPSSRSSDTTQGTTASTLFPPASASSPADSANVRPTDNVMNKVGDKEQSLFQICVGLRQRLIGVPGFDAFLQEEEQSADEDTDPVTLMWRTFRRGYPLLALYNVLRPEKPIQADLSNMSSELKKGKAMTFKFLNACINDLGFSATDDCFIILDLYGDDTTGFVRVTKTVTKLLDILVEQNIIEDTRRDSAEPGAAGKRSQRQHIVDELVNTERTYVQQLEMLQAFQVQCQKTGVVPGDIVHQIFLNLNGLLDFQRRFLIRVEQINAMPEDEQNWGKLFILYNDTFSIYEPYITNQKQCEATVMREFEKLRLAGGTADMQGIVANPSTLYSFLMKPFQRLSKYPLLLDQLYKKGDLDEERKSDLLIGKECATAVLSRTNAAMEREDRLAAVEELQGRVEDWKGHRVEQFGELLLFGNFTVIKSDSGPSRDSEREYHVYFFESIILCCKDIDPNRSKNKMKPKPGMDKKNKTKLQLKGRIFTQNVTDVISASKQGSYTCQIFWKGDPGIENFTIKFLTEDLMQKWYSELVRLKKLWDESNRRTMTSTTEFTSMQMQPQMENPYAQQDDDEEDDSSRQAPSTRAPSSRASYHSTQPAQAEYSNAWTQSQGARARSGTNESGPSTRMAPPRLPAGALNNANLSVRTQNLQSAFSPAERPADSYFSPTEESMTMSSRTSTSSSVYPVTRHGHFSEGGYPTSHLPYRSGSREMMHQMGHSSSRHPVRPAYASGGPIPGRNRSISSPSINDAQRRLMEGERPPMPGAPLPQHMHYPSSIQRSQSNSPHLMSGNIDERMSSNSPQLRQYNASPSLGGFPPNRMPYQRDMISPPLPPSTPVMNGEPPSQLKVKVHATAAGQVLTLVVPSNITYQTLKDRIDAKLQRSTNISLTDRGSGNQVKLKYLDEEDYVNIASDEDVQTAFETWREQHGEGVNGMGEIELYCQ